MKLNINIPATPKRTRILAAFMAFLIFALTFQEAFVGWDFGTKVKAYPTAGDGIVTSKPSYSKYMGQNNYTTSHDSTGNSNGSYTGKILPVTVSMYDYLTDAEIDSNYNTTWNNPKSLFRRNRTGLSRASGGTFDRKGRQRDGQKRAHPPVFHGGRGRHPRHRRAGLRAL